MGWPGRGANLRELRPATNNLHARSGARYLSGVKALLVYTLAAAQSSVWDQLKSIPKQTWINIGICVLTVVVIIKVWKVLKTINEFVPYIVGVLAAFLIFFYWVYERTEPSFLSPIVDKLAPFFPSKGTQDQIKDKRRRGRDV